MSELLDTVDLTGALSGRVGQQFLVHSGLLWKLNSEWLHPAGLALAVVDHTDGTVSLSLTPADDGVWTVPAELAEERAAWFLEFLDERDRIREGLLRGLHRDGDG